MSVVNETRAKNISTDIILILLLKKIVEASLYNP